LYKNDLFWVQLEIMIKLPISRVSSWRRTQKTGWWSKPI